MHYFVMGHILEYMLVWVLNVYVPWIPVAKNHDKLSFLHRVYGKSITA